MKRSHVAALLLAMSIISSPVTANADSANIAYMSCSMGDHLDITLDTQAVEWSISNSNIVSKDGNVLVVKEEGQCDLVNEDTGFIIKLTSSGKSEDSGVLELNYNSVSDTSEDVIVRDKTVDIQTVEVNSSITTEDSAVVEGFSSDLDEYVDSSQEEVQLEPNEDEVFTDSEDEIGIEFVDTDEELFSDGSEDMVTVEHKENPNDDKIVSEDDIDDMSILDEKEVTAKEEGNFVIEHTSGDTDIVKVVEPELNQYVYQGSVGQSTSVGVTNLDVACTYSSSNEDVATVDNSGNVELIGTGESTISVSTENNTKTCKVISLTPEVDTEEELVQRGKDYQIKVNNNFADLPVSYEIIDGDGTVSDTGLVKLNGNVKVKTTINNSYSYTKSLVTTTIHDEYWEAMQPAIQRCLGTPYVFGGESPGVGLDCSAYVSYVYNTVGLMNSRLTAQGIYDICTKTSQPLPGDLVFFTGTYNAGEFITHIGIYAGNNQMYHSGNPNQLASIDTAYWRSHLVGFGTMINSNMSSPVTGYSLSGYTQEQLELLWAITAQECSTSYEGALAVITCAMNRASTNYGGYGTDPLSQYMAPNQFCYSPSVSDPSLWQRRLNGNVDEFVKQAVYDCVIGGKRNHRFTSFRGNPVSGAVNIGDNWYFNE